MKKALLKLSRLFKRPNYHIRWEILPNPKVPFGSFGCGWYFSIPEAIEIIENKYGGGSEVSIIHIIKFE